LSKDFSSCYNQVRTFALSLDVFDLKKGEATFFKVDGAKSICHGNLNEYFPVQ
jgi:hypothetical protein